MMPAMSCAMSAQSCHCFCIIVVWLGPCCAVICHTELKLGVRKWTARSLWVQAGI
jgi:hypothetical protein